MYLYLYLNTILKVSFRRLLNTQTCIVDHTDYLSLVFPICNLSKYLGAVHNKNNIFENISLGHFYFKKIKSKQNTVLAYK